jgi:N-acetylglucosaminyl-diphospho-decaprenol L-rhamnosyltransferase
VDTTPPGLGVVVVSYNTRELLASCLASLGAEITRAAISTETWVVDNASADGSPAMVAANFPWVHLLALETNVGFAAANNRVLRAWLDQPHTAPPCALILNPDTEIRPGAVTALVGALRSDPSAGVVGPAFVFPDGRFQHGAFRFPGLVQTALDLVPIPRLTDSRLNGRYPHAIHARGTPFVVDFPLGACLLVRTSAVRSVGLLDEGYFMYAEEVDWCRRMRARGYRALCVPSAVVVHHAGASTRRAPERMFVALWRSRLRYFARHEGRCRRVALTALVRLGFTLRSYADRAATGRGRLDEADRRARAEAYRAVFARREG